MVKIAVDMMGSDLGPEELSKGLVRFLSEYEDAEAVAFGDSQVLQGTLHGVERVEIQAAETVVPMEVSPFVFLRKYSRSSMYLACQKAGSDDSIAAVVSSGSTGGFLVGCHTKVGRLPGVAREGLAAPMITAVPGFKTLILDIGANNTCTGNELVCFAKMGEAYARKVFGRENPKVFLLSNGVEEGKGLKETVDAYELLKGQPYFGGMCEARDALDGQKDVVVTTGYPGNIFLKCTEGTAVMILGVLKKACTKNLFTKIGYLLAKPGLREMKKNMDYRETGGAILLGVKKVAVKSHGNSNAYAFYNALKLAYSTVKSGAVSAIAKEIAHEG